MYLVLRCKINFEIKDNGFLLLTLTKLAIFLTNFLVCFFGVEKKRSQYPKNLAGASLWKLLQKCTVKNGLAQLSGIKLIPGKIVHLWLHVQYPKVGICLSN